MNSANVVAEFQCNLLNERALSTREPCTCEYVTTATYVMWHLLLLACLDPEIFLPLPEVVQCIEHLAESKTDFTVELDIQNVRLFFQRLGLYFEDCCYESIVKPLYQTV